VINPTTEQQALLNGAAGSGSALAMRIMLRFAEAVGAQRLIDISRAHIDGCLYHGPVSVDFARTLAEGGARVKVPATLNVSAIDYLHPELFRGDPGVATASRELLKHYTAMGCQQTWTCAPYQLPDRPAFGEQIAWAESNAIVFANSVLGARTERYGDFIDICAAITGVVPQYGLHTDDGRLATTVLRVSVSRQDDVFFAGLGHLLGRVAGSSICAIDGIDAATEDQLKSVGAAAASSGSVALFHMVGVTPEAPTLRDALGGRNPTRTLDIGTVQIAQAIGELSTTSTSALSAVSIGTPHFSYNEFTRLRSLLEGRRARIDFYVNTSRDIMQRLHDEGWADELLACGITFVTDTCTYIAPILQNVTGAVMTNSAKWAWYAPNNLGYEVVFGSLEECVESAIRGEVWRSRLPV
jgi:predicted aconitase